MWSNKKTVQRGEKTVNWYTRTVKETVTGEKIEWIDIWNTVKKQYYEEKNIELMYETR